MARRVTRLFQDDTRQWWVNIIWIRWIHSFLMAWLVDSSSRTADSCQQISRTQNLLQKRRVENSRLRVARIEALKSNYILGFWTRKWFEVFNHILTVYFVFLHLVYFVKQFWCYFFMIIGLIRVKDKQKSEITKGFVKITHFLAVGVFIGFRNKGQMTLLPAQNASCIGKLRPLLSAPAFSFYDRKR